MSTLYEVLRTCMEWFCRTPEALHQFPSDNVDTFAMLPDPDRERLRRDYAEIMRGLRS